MLKTLAKPTAMLAGGLFLVSTSLPVQAEQMMRLDDVTLDQVTAGATVDLRLYGTLPPSSVDGTPTAATANGSLYSSSEVAGGVVGFGDQRRVVAYGVIVGVGVAASGTPGAATASAGTDGVATGDYTFRRTITAGGNSRFGAFRGSGTFVLGVDLEL